MRVKCYFQVPDSKGGKGGLIERAFSIYMAIISDKNVFYRRIRGMDFEENR